MIGIPKPGEPNLSRHDKSALVATLFSCHKTSITSGIVGSGTSSSTRMLTSWSMSGKYRRKNGPIVQLSRSATHVCYTILVSSRRGQVSMARVAKHQSHIPLRNL